MKFYCVTLPSRSTIAGPKDNGASLRIVQGARVILVHTTLDGYGANTCAMIGGPSEADGSPALLRPEDATSYSLQGKLVVSFCRRKHVSFMMATTTEARTMTSRLRLSWLSGGHCAELDATKPFMTIATRRRDGRMAKDAASIMARRSRLSHRRIEHR